MDLSVPLLSTGLGTRAYLEGGWEIMRGGLGIPNGRKKVQL